MPRKPYTDQEKAASYVSKRANGRVSWVINNKDGIHSLDVYAPSLSTVFIIYSDASVYYRIAKNADHSLMRINDAQRKKVYNICVAAGKKF